MEAALVTSAARFLGQRVADLLQLDKKLKELVGIEGKMEKLKDLSTIIDVVIQDVEACSVTDAAVKNLLRNLKHLAYDLEDVVDYYDTEASRKQRSRAYSRPVRDFFSSNNNQLVFRSRISGMITAVTENLHSILLQKSILENLPRGTNWISPSAYREIHSHNSLAVIGRETEKETIVNMLTDDEGSSDGTIKVIGIVGMGGLGKTTLARHVFNDERVKVYFENFSMWKVVGPEFDPTEIMKSILQLATRVPVSISEPELVREKLQKALSKKRFLLVLDDVWNEDASQWQVLKAGLTCGARGSKILVTTRSPEVSSIMGSFNTHHQIQKLSGDDCLSLFQQFAFGDEEANENLMKIGRKIVEKCGGVPLAAKSLGSMLHRIRDESRWSSVMDGEVWQLRDEDKKFLAVLKLSYDALPPRSKKCFEFGSLFEKNYMMKKDELIQLWTANGFVCSEGHYDAETDGNCIFDDLVLRSFFLLAPPEECDDGRHVIECTMHDLMHDLARTVCGDEYCNLKYNRAEDIQKRTYHLSVGCQQLQNISQAVFNKSLCLRTLRLIYDGSYPKAKLLQLIFSELKFLRVLELRHNGICEVPTSVGNLIHLRYLDLSHNAIRVLPDTITLLQNLQYLNLEQNYYLRELPKKLRNMQSLRYLGYESNKLTHMPPELSRLTSLRSLSCFIAEKKTGSCSITELEDLKLHGEMEIRFSQNYRNYSRVGRKILQNKDFNKLLLRFNCSESNDVGMLDDLCPNTSLKNLQISDYGSRQFPTWLMESQLPNLVEVTLVECNLCEHIPRFGNLQFLRSLVIEGMDGVKHMGADFHGHGPISGFPSLQTLMLKSMTNFEEWSESDGVDELFPLLKKLEIYNCPKLKNMPRLPRVEQLTLINCSESLLSCVGRMTSLSQLILESIKGMTSLPCGCLRNLTSLTALNIQLCNELQFLPRDEMQHLTMIHSLVIGECKNLTSFPIEVGRFGALRYLCLQNRNSDALQPEILIQILNSQRQFDMMICGKIFNLRGQLQHLHTLRKLYIGCLHQFSHLMLSGSHTRMLSICCCDELESLMTAAPSTSELEVLRISNIPNLATLPEWLQHLGSLHRLLIYNCPQLGSLPRGLQDLHSLEYLNIRNCCQQLKRRCKMETGEDWPNISHVPYIDISTEGFDEAPRCGPFSRFFGFDPIRIDRRRIA